MSSFFKFFKRTSLDLIQVLLLCCMYAVLRPLPSDKVSNLGGWVVRWIGPKLALSRRARKNLALALPNLSEDEKTLVIQGMWENLGRTMAEYIHLPRLKIYSENSPVEVRGAEIIDALREDGKGAVLFLAHLANWELATLVASRRGLPLTQLYRKLNYPLTDKLINLIHRQVAAKVITKGAEGGKQMIAALKAGEHVSMLSDQKLNEGESIPFFGRPAMTAPAGARLALKYHVPFVPVRVERIDGTYFRVTYFPPLTPNVKGDIHAQTKDLLKQMNRHLESWIRARPEQWFWLHRRWAESEQLF